MTQQTRLELAVAAVRAEPSRLCRARLVELADGFKVPFKTLVERLEAEGLIWAGTYQEIMDRFRTVKAFREFVQESRTYAAWRRGVS